jgi:tetratricopeptide (TPR) repeat protein
MRRVLTATARILPPAFVLFLFVDLLMNPNIPRLGSTTESVTEPGRLSANVSRDLLERTRRLVGEGKDVQALEPALQLYKAWPENYLYIRTLAEIYHRLGRRKEEAEYWERFMQYAPLPLEGCPDIGQAYWAQQRYNDAIAAYERCLSFDPQMSDSLFFLGHALELRGNFGRAAELYRRALEHDAKSMDCRVGLARVDMRMGRLAEAKKLVLGALEDSPQNLDALLVAGMVYWSEGDLVRAKQYLVKGAGLSTGYADYYLVLGRIEESQGNVAAAVMRYGRALELQPDNADAARRLRALSGRPR